MQFDRTTSIDTPEGVRLDITLAGLGSRAGAQLVDSLVKVAGGIAILYMLSNLELGFQGAFAAILVLGTLSLVVYELAFEALWAGRTPGKAAFGIRVVNADGSPARFAAVAVRNVLRIIDVLPVGYGIGVVLVFVTKRHQRLGDLAAGTIVVRDRATAPLGPVTSGPPVTVPPGFDATAVRGEDVAVIRQYLARAGELDHLTRNRLAAQIATPLRERVFSPGPPMGDLTLLRTIVAAKDAGG